MKIRSSDYETGRLAPTVDAGIEPLAALCKASGDPLRLQILRVLKGNAYGVLELSHIFRMRQNAMSHHLKLLASAGLVASRREGNHIYYRRVQMQGPLTDVIKTLFGSIDRAGLDRPLLAGIEAVQQERNRQSREFFLVNADKFREQQDLIASYPQYGEIVVALIDRLAGTAVADALEVGPGEGELLPDLHRRYRQVTALDNSPEMLYRAESLARSTGLDNIRFVQGDTRTGVETGLRADLITLNMVLHHTPAPAAVIEDLAGILRPGGSLIITELCQHHQDWARSACGDLWLGFAAEDLVAWAADAGLEPGLVENLALRNGFRVQIRQFRKPPEAADGTRELH